MGMPDSDIKVLLQAQLSAVFLAAPTASPRGRRTFMRSPRQNIRSISARNSFLKDGPLIELSSSGPPSPSSPPAFWLSVLLLSGVFLQPTSSSCPGPDIIRKEEAGSFCLVVISRRLIGGRDGRDDASCLIAAHRESPRLVSNGPEAIATKQP